LYAQLGDPRALQAHGLEVGLLILVVSTCDELVWRGLVPSLLAEHVGSRTAWAWSAALWAISMIPTMWALRAAGSTTINPVLVVAALGLGLGLGALARSVGRITPGIVAHAMFDWAIVMTFPLWGVRG
jgi:membrane protease YdiL (CAAX protease family)